MTKKLIETILKIAFTAFLYLSVVESTSCREKEFSGQALTTKEIKSFGNYQDPQSANNCKMEYMLASALVHESVPRVFGTF